MAFIAKDGTAVLSPSDIAGSAECEFRWLRGIDEQLGRVGRIDVHDAFAERLARLGDAHEARHLDRLRAGHEVVEIERPRPYTMAGLRAAAEQTREALASRAPVVAQAAFFDGSLAGFADVLVLDAEGRYEVWDVKLARHARVSAVLQLACYADQLDRLGIPRASRGHLLLGDSTTVAVPLEEAIAVHRRRRAYLTRLLETHRARPGPVSWGDDGYSLCGACPHCEAQIVTAEDVLLVAGLSRRQRQHLGAAGVRTVGELAATTATVPGIPERTWRTLRAQAALQERALRDQTAATAYEVFDTGPIDALPAPDAGDVFFDFEGDPLWTDADGHAEGLEYLFGALDLDDPAGRFVPLWAHDRGEERRALVAFLDWVTERRSRHPGMHVYHYAPYETAALKRLTVRHAVGEDVLDDLLRAGVFVDLYATVRQSVRVAQPSYSIKKLEPLYMGSELRDADGVTTAADSVLQYHEHVEARQRGDETAAARLLEEIGDYNRYDCLSTWRLRDWLLRHRRDPDDAAVTSAIATSAIATSVSEPAPTGRDAPVDANASSSGVPAPGAPQTPSISRIAELQAIADRLLAHVPEEAGERTPEQQGVALLAAALGYYRRENKPMWWAYFDRCVSPVDEWLEPRGTLVAEEIEVLAPWERRPRARTLSRGLRVTGRLEPGSTIRPGAEVRGVYEDVPAGWELATGAVRAMGRSGKVVEVGIADDGRDVVELTESTRTTDQPHHEVPMAIVEHTHIRVDSLERAIGELAERVLEAGSGGLPRDAACDVLARRAPRLSGGDLGALGDDDLSPATLARAVTALKDSYLAVQGPPGTGKTHVGSRAVADLVGRGWRVGVVAQSHAAVEHFLTAVIKAGVAAERVGKKPRNDASAPASTTASTTAWTSLTGTGEVERFLAGTGGLVLGGTAWTFAAPTVRGLDLLVVDEAGQFSLAHTLAASRAASRLLLLGDPQQLPQVSQGSHPEPVEASALGWLAGDHDTLPPEMGVFLARSWRMHSALTLHVSALAYDGRLTSQEDVTDTRELTGVAPGLHPVPVPHIGNSVTSVEEAAEVVRLVRRLCEESWRGDASSPLRRLAPTDIIVVAAYNAQVATLRTALDAAGLDKVGVGTVDLFQGQEAPVTIVSLAASSADDVPRGLEFLLDHRRLNVAISRAQWASFLVHSPLLADTHPTSIEGVAVLGRFLSLLEGAPPTPR